jgi:hypothetical protein
MLESQRKVEAALEMGPERGIKLGQRLRLRLHGCVCAAASCKV